MSTPGSITHREFDNLENNKPDNSTNELDVLCCLGCSSPSKFYCLKTCYFCKNECCYTCLHYFNALKFGGDRKSYMCSDCYDMIV